MSDVLGNCLQQTNGSHFYRGDLHIHSYLASHDVKDSNMTPENIVRTAIDENLELIAIADHNEISNVAECVDIGNKLGIFVVPAVELSTPEGHLLCYFPSIEALHTFHGRLDLADRGTANSRCKTSMYGCLDLVGTLGGFSVLAHVDGGNGFETNCPGGSPHKIDVVCHPALLGIELKSAASVVSYAADDPDTTRVGIGRQRINSLGLGERQYLARVLNSDSHALTALGRNAAQDRKLTRYKMAFPTFEGLRMAMRESDSRIRLEDEIPAKTPFVLGMSMNGGFLSGQTIHFSSNLNCIIGGRGSGKSTTFEAVRCLTGFPSDAEVVDSEVWPQQLNLVWQDEAGQRHLLSRAINDEVVNLEDPENGPISFGIDCFGQGEASKVREQSKTDPLALLNYLDTFTGAQDLVSDEEEALGVIIELQKSISEAEKNIQQIPVTQRSLSVAQQQLKAFESAKGTEVIKLQRSLAGERAKKEDINSKIESLQETIKDPSVSEILEDMLSSLEDESIAIGVEEAKGIISELKAFDASFKKAQLITIEALEKLSSTVSSSIKNWNAKEQPVRTQIEQKRAELEAVGVKLDMAHITALSKQEAQLKKDLETLRSWEPHLVELKRSYSEALKERWIAKKQISNARQGYAVKASRSLAEVLSDLQVKLQYIENGHSNEAVQIIAGALNWRTVSYGKARAIIEQVTLPGLLAALYKSDPAQLLSVKGEAGIALFSKTDSQEIIEKLKEPETLAALERCHVDDLPRLTVTRKIETDGAAKYLQRDFSQLSLGQQQSVLLALILSSDSKRPLIIDQPEDNLDSEFIFHTFVPVLRRAKERRQVIIVTHNANIAVLGDAEQLIVFKSNSEKSKIVARGSIDDQSAKEAACKILEGAREAFTRRAAIYGIN